MKEVMYIQSRDSDAGYRINQADLSTVEVNYQLNSNYEITFTLTYTSTYRKAFDAAKAKANVFYDGEIYNIQQADTEISKDGLLQLKVTASHSLIDKMRNCRIDTKYPTEANPDVTGGTSGSSIDKPNQPGVVTKKTDEKKTYTLDDRLKQFFNNNDQGIKYELHGNFPQAAVEIENTSLFEWLNQNLKQFGGYYVPVGNTLYVYDLKNIQHETGRQFRYQSNMNNADVQIDVNDIVNDCDVYGGKMEKDITTGGGSGSLESAEAFAKSSINANFNVNKQQMLSEFAARDVRVRAWGVDVNRLYDTVKGAGVSPEWFFAYDLQEGNPTSYSWLNHFGNHLADPYQDAIRVCNWIKTFAYSDSFTPASGFGAYTSPQLAAKWNQEFGKGTIGRLYLQGTAAAVMELANENPGRYGRPLAGCANQIKAWGGHGGPSGGAAKWIAVAKSFVGIPYVWGGGHSGNNPRAGMDCSGLGEQIAKACGFDIGGGDTTALERASTPISREQVQTGDMGFYGPQGGSYHVVWALDNNTFVAEPKPGDRCYIAPISSYPPHFWKRHPKIAAFVGTGATSGGDGLSTETQSYYSLYFHYEDKESIKKYGRHRGKAVTYDSIYDMKLLKQQADTDIQHNPKMTLTAKDIFERDFRIGDVWHLIIPEMHLKESVTLLGIKYKPFNPDNSDATLTFNNSGLVHNVIGAIYQDIRGINGLRANEFNTLTTTTQRTEDHFANIVTLSAADMEKLKEFTEGGS